MPTNLRHRILLHAYVTEKSMDEMERQNKLEFMVDHRATRAEIRRAVEEIYQCKVAKVNTKIVRNGKIATVRFRPEYSAEDIGSRAGVF
jgi:large subunit ribosomal protein L23